MKEELGMALARNEAKRLSEKKKNDFSDVQEEMEIPLQRERLCTRFRPASKILGLTAENATLRRLTT